MRTFRVIAVLPGNGHSNCFTITGGLIRLHGDQKYRSLTAARIAADGWAASGWDAMIVRRATNGWHEVETWWAEMPTDDE